MGVHHQSFSGIPRLCLLFFGLLYHVGPFVLHVLYSVRCYTKRIIFLCSSFPHFSFLLNSYRISQLRLDDLSMLNSMIEEDFLLGFIKIRPPSIVAVFLTPSSYFDRRCLCYCLQSGILCDWFTVLSTKL